MSPTRELAGQIFRELKRLCTGKKWRLCLLTGQHNRNVDFHTRKFGKQTEGHISSIFADILVTTPLRLVHIVQEKQVKMTK